MPVNFRSELVAKQKVVNYPLRLRNDLEVIERFGVRFSKQVARTSSRSDLIEEKLDS